MTYEQETKLLLGLVYILSFFMGGTVASALRCLFDRVRTGRRWTRGRSRCDYCGHTLRSLDLVPVLSCILSRARCRYCHHYYGYGHAVFEAVLGLFSVFLVNLLFKPVVL